MSTPPKLIGTLESALYAQDLDQAARFWTNVIGLAEIARAPGRHVFFRCGAQVLLVFRASATREPPRPDARLPVPPHGCDGPGHFCMAAGPGTFDAWRAHLEASGIEVEADFIWPQGAGRCISAIRPETPSRSPIPRSGPDPSGGGRAPAGYGASRRREIKGETGPSLTTPRQTVPSERPAPPTDRRAKCHARCSSSHGHRR